MKDLTKGSSCTTSSYVVHLERTLLNNCLRDLRVVLLLSCTLLSYFGHFAPVKAVVSVVNAYVMAFQT